MIPITAAICTYNRYDVLPKAIDSLKKQTLDSDRYQVIVVDNSPDREYALEMKQKYEELPLIKYVHEKTPGLSNARNVSAKMCGTPYIAYMDDDAIANPDWLENIINAFETFGEKAAVVGGKVDPLWEIERPSWLGDSLLGYVSVVDWGGDIRVAKDNEWFAGTNIAFRTESILDNGGFDTSLGRNGGGSILMSNEEIGLLESLKEQGCLPIYAPNVVVSHLVEEKRVKQSWFRQRVAWQALSDYMMNPEQSISHGKNAWGFVLEYFFGLPPKERNIRGLFHETDDPQEFQEQLWVITTVTTMMMAGFDGVE